MHCLRQCCNEPINYPITRLPNSQIPEDAAMWTRKAFRDLKKNVDSPMPTQVVSNEEFVPRPQTPQQKQVEILIGEMADERSKKLGIGRRAFMASSMGMATCFLASNKVYGKTYWD